MMMMMMMMMMMIIATVINLVKGNITFPRNVVDKLYHNAVGLSRKNHHILMGKVKPLIKKLKRDSINNKHNRHYSRQYGLNQKMYGKICSSVENEVR
jgi:hypothetical protein